MITAFFTTAIWAIAVVKYYSPDTFMITLGTGLWVFMMSETVILIETGRVIIWMIMSQSQGLLI